MQLERDEDGGPCGNTEDLIFYTKNKSFKDFRQQVTSFFSFWLLVGRGHGGGVEGQSVFRRPLQWGRCRWLE